MAKKFFSDWALWEKMVFILGCAIVVTVFLGLLKLSYTHWRVRKYTALEKLARRVSIVREKSIIRSLSTRRKGEPTRQSSSRYKPQEKSGPDVPFGIKALESGVEVEGVWDSRPNSRRSSFAHGQTPATSNGHVIDMSMVDAGLLSEESKGSLTVSTAPSQQFERAVSAERLGTEPPSPDLHPAFAGRKYPPHAFMRYEGIQGHRTVNTFSSLTSDTRRQSSSQRTSSNSSRRSRRTNQGSSPTSPGSSQLVTPNRRTERAADDIQDGRMRSTSAHSINAMQYRRASQVAESGQFHPRIRGDGSTSRQSSIERQRRYSSDIADLNPNETSIPGGFTYGQPDTPEIHIIGSSPPQESSMYAAAPYDADAEYMKSQFEPPLRLSSRGRSGSAPSEAQNSATPKRSSFSVTDRGNPQVLRQVNEGFAILRPGTLDALKSTPQTASAGDNTAGANGNVEKRSSRKLQKRRASQDSQRSSKRSLEIFRS